MTLQKFRQLSILGPGEAFGELSLLTNQLRAATVICLTDCKFATLSRQDYFWSIGQEARKKLQENIKTLRGFRLFQQLSSEILAMIHQLMVPETYNHGQVVYTQGSPVDRSGVYFITQGDFEVSQIAASETPKMVSDYSH